MPTGEIIGLIGAIVSVLTALAVWRRLPHENRATDAGVVEKYAQASGLTAQQNVQYIELIKRLECEKAAQEKDFDEYKRETDRRFSAFEREIRRRDDEINRLDDMMMLYGKVLSEWMVGIQKDITQLRTIGVKPAWAPEISPALRNIWLQEAKIMDGSG
jgi:uncharacterized protein (UPF0335 family)